MAEECQVQLQRVHGGLLCGRMSMRVMITGKGMVDIQFNWERKSGRSCLFSVSHCLVAHVDADNDHPAMWTRQGRGLKGLSNQLRVGSMFLKSLLCHVCVTVRVSSGRFRRSVTTAQSMHWH